jgi:hypothetical protein
MKLLTILLAAAFALPSALAATKPNIVILYADDMGFGDLAQKQNLYATEPAKVKELTALLESIRAKGQVR